MKFEKTKVYNIDGALRGMRNPKNSWGKSDSYFDADNNFKIGENDMKLCQSLVKGGAEHRKFMRQIFVSVDIVDAPVYWLREFDTYKINTTSNSCSIQHTGAKEYDEDDFVLDYYDDLHKVSENVRDVLFLIINQLNILNNHYMLTGDYRYFRLMRQLMPMGIKYRLTWTCNYENLYTMVHQRKNHKLDEWSKDFIKWVKTLPYADELIFKKGNKHNGSNR